MIAETKTKSSFTSQVIDARLSTRSHASSDVNEFAGAIRRVMPKKRDREVPYGMKGGEH
jgi:hypothetical protein